MTTILLAIGAAVLGGLLYTLVGIIPGTDETATMVPITIILVLAGAPAGVLFAWEIGIIVAMQISHTIPTAMSALPGSTMAVPMVLNCSIAKRLACPTWQCGRWPPALLWALSSRCPWPWSWR